MISQLFNVVFHNAVEFLIGVKFLDAFELRFERQGELLTASLQLDFYTQLFHFERAMIV